MKISQRFKFHFPMISALVLVMIVFSAPQAVQAQGIGRGDSLPAGMIVQGDGFFYGATVTIDGDVDGDVFAMGNEIKINGKISGSLVAAGKKVVLNSDVGGTVYSTAIEFNLAPNANLNRNLYFAGASMNTQAGSLVNRDVFAATLGAQMAGSVSGDVKAIIGPAEFFYLIMERINRSVGRLSVINLSSTALESSNSLLPPGVAGGGMVFSALTSLKPTMLGAMENASLQQAASIDWSVVGNWFLERLRELVRLFVFGLLGLWLMPQLFPGSAQILRSKPLPSTGWGLLGLVISFNLLGVVVLLAVAIGAIGLFLGAATLWDLAWSFMAISGFSLGLASTIFALSVMYISKSLVAYFAGRMILERIIPAATHRNVFPLLTGVLIYVFLAAIPILGWVISLLVTALGIGAAWLFYRSNRVQPTQPESESLGVTESAPAQPA